MIILKMIIRIIILHKMIIQNDYSKWLFWNDYLKMIIRIIILHKMIIENDYFELGLGVRVRVTV